MVLWIFHTRVWHDRVHFRSTVPCKGGWDEYGNIKRLLNIKGPGCRVGETVRQELEEWQAVGDAIEILVAAFSVLFVTESSRRGNLSGFRLSTLTSQPSLYLLSSGSTGMYHHHQPPWCLTTNLSLRRLAHSGFLPHPIELRTVLCTWHPDFFM